MYIYSWGNDMLFKGPDSNIVYRNRNFLVFLSSQLISGVGDIFHFMAVTTLIMKITGSGLATGFSIICTSIPGIFLSLIAGSFGDRFHSRHLLAVMDVLRGLVAFAFVFCKSLWLAYLLMVLLSSFDTFYSPTRSKLITGILRKEEYIVGNSVMSGASGIVYVFGSALAGALVELKGMEAAFALNALSFFVSAVLILNMSLPGRKKALSPGPKTRGIVQSISGGLRYSLNAPVVKEVISVSAIISICAVSVNIAFYSFAFDTLGLDSKGWGLILSVMYGMNLTAMLISMAFKRRISKATLFFVYVLLLIVALVWYGYGSVIDLKAVLLLQMFEGTALCLCGIYMYTKLQAVVKREYVSRVFGVNDLVTNVSKVLGVIYTYVVLKFYSPMFIFILSSFLMGAFSLYKIFTSDQRKITRRNKD